MDLNDPKNLEKFISVLDAEGFTIKSSSSNTYEIVAKVGA